MNSHLNDSDPLQVHPKLPNGNKLLGLLWPQPATPGFYNGDGYGSIVLTTNHCATLGSVPKSITASILALEGGGFSPVMAASFKTISNHEILSLLNRLKQNEQVKEGNRLYVSVSLSQLLKWKNGDMVEGLPIGVISDKPDDWISDMSNGRRNSTNLSLFMKRMINMPSLWLGQVIILSIPLAIFGCQSLLIGLINLFIAGFILALFWDLLPGRGWVKGGILGVVLGILLGLCCQMNMIMFQPVLMGVGMGLSVLWMGIVFDGLS